MMTARQRMIARKRRLGIRPACRKRTLTPKATCKPDQVVTGIAPHSNPNFFSPLPPPVRHRGGQPDNTNRLVHGRYTKHMDAFQADVRTYLRAVRADLAWVRSRMGETRESLANHDDARAGALL